MIGIMELEAIRWLLGEVKQWDEGTTETTLWPLRPDTHWELVGQFWVATNAAPTITLAQVQAGIILRRARQQRSRAYRRSDGAEVLDGRNVVYEVIVELVPVVFVVVQWRVVERG